MTYVDHRTTSEGREGFLAAISYLTLAGQMSIDPTERSIIAGLVRALRRKVDTEYPAGSDEE